jgi:hypothetical protein
LYSFDDFVFDTERRELRRGSRLIPLQPQVFDLLEYLIVNRHRVVSKDDLIAVVWSGRILQWRRCAGPDQVKPARRQGSQAQKNPQARRTRGDSRRTSAPAL